MKKLIRRLLCKHLWNDWTGETYSVCTKCGKTQFH